MTTEQWLIVGMFALGVASNAGIVWHGISTLEKRVEQLHEEIEDIKKGEYHE